MAYLASCLQQSSDAERTDRLGQGDATGWPFVTSPFVFEPINPQAEGSNVRNLPLFRNHIPSHRGYSARLYQTSEWEIGAHPIKGDIAWYLPQRGELRVHLRAPDGGSREITLPWPPTKRAKPLSILA